MTKIADIEAPIGAGYQCEECVSGGRFPITVKRILAPTDLTDEKREGG